MNLVFFAHPLFLEQQSMARYVTLLADGMKKRGHVVEVWHPKACFFHLGFNAFTKKWLGYIDQYMLFPLNFNRLIRKLPLDTLFIFTDHAMGPWVIHLHRRMHVIHCHDFLAQLSGSGRLPGHQTGWTGQKYQSYIKWGYTKGTNFISVSEKTRRDLHLFLTSEPSISTVVYNGLNHIFCTTDKTWAREMLGKAANLTLADGYLLHVGSNLWYKNRMGVIEIYNAWREMSKQHYPLLMIGQKPDNDLIQAQKQSAFANDIHFLTHITDELLVAAYAGAWVLIFPSYAEGFGWPVAEAMASGCPVITTNEPPMTEVAGTAGFFIPKRPFGQSAVLEWAQHAGKLIDSIIGLSEDEYNRVVESGLENAKRFDMETALNDIEKIYTGIINATHVRGPQTVIN